MTQKGASNRTGQRKITCPEFTALTAISLWLFVMFVHFGSARPVLVGFGTFRDSLLVQCPSVGAPSTPISDQHQRPVELRIASFSLMLPQWRRQCQRLLLLLVVVVVVVVLVLVRVPR